MAKRLLFVDDEVDVLESLISGFSFSDYEIFSASSGIEALSILEKENIELILADTRMPDMDGFELLKQVKEKYPKLIRVILSEFADRDEVVKAVQYNTAKLYVYKPWQNEELIQIFDQLFGTEELLEKCNLSLFVNNLMELPTIPTSFQRIMRLIDQDAEISKISEEIEHDQAIASKVLHVANSAFYNMKTGSVKFAVAYIGLLNTRNLLLSTSVLDMFQGSGVVAKNMANIWQHAYLTNRVLFYIYENCLNKKLPDSCQSAGLLHNVGVVFFLKFNPKAYIKILDELFTKNADILDMERAMSGITHQEAGGYLLKWWDLPYPIVETALYHHSPSNPSIINKELVSAVHIAIRHAWKLLKNKNFTWDQDMAAYEILGIGEEEMNEHLKGFKM